MAPFLHCRIVSSYSGFYTRNHVYSPTRKEILLLSSNKDVSCPSYAVSASPMMLSQPASSGGLCAFQRDPPDQRPQPLQSLHPRRSRLSPGSGHAAVLGHVLQAHRVILPRDPNLRAESRILRGQRRNGPGQVHNKQTLLWKHKPR